jgi:hypothetical protein
MRSISFPKAPAVCILRAQNQEYLDHMQGKKALRTEQRVSAEKLVKESNTTRHHSPDNESFHHLDKFSTASRRGDKNWNGRDFTAITTFCGQLLYVLKKKIFYFIVSRHVKD